MFGPEMVKNLPEPARRFLSRAIAPGMPLADSVELEMHGALPWRRTGILCQLWSLIPLVRGDGPDVGDEAVETTLEVDADGRPVRAVALRWSERAGPDYEPFVVELSGELRAEGYTVPSRIEAAWSLGEGDEFRFFEATLDRATFR